MIPSRLSKPLVILFVFLFDASPILAARVEAKEEQVVGVHQAAVRKAPSALSHATGKLSYGSKVKILGTRPGWYQVKSGRIEGWIHQSAFVNSRLILKDIGKNAANNSAGPDPKLGPNRREIATAGRGTSEEANRELAKENPALRFDLVEKLESRDVTTEAMIAFALEGQLKKRTPGGHK